MKVKKPKLIAVHALDLCKPCNGSGCNICDNKGYIVGAKQSVHLVDGLIQFVK